MAEENNKTSIKTSAPVIRSSRAIFFSLKKSISAVQNAERGVNWAFLSHDTALSARSVLSERAVEKKHGESVRYLLKKLWDRCVFVGLVLRLYCGAVFILNASCFCPELHTPPPRPANEMLPRI